MKFCTRCGETKVFSLFNIDRNTKDGYTSGCKDCRNKCAALYREANKERIKCRSKKLYDSYSQVDHMFHAARNRANMQGIPFELTKEDIKIPLLCPVFKTTLVRGKGKPTENSPSLDKLIPTLGYVKGNVFVISQRANRIKNDSTLQELEALVEWVNKQQDNGGACQ